MSSPSNIYAEKVFSEHPIALWPLDDKADYISLISQENRDLTLWDVSSAELDTASIFGPILQSPTDRLIGDEPDELGSIILKSPDLTSFDLLNTDLGSFAVSAFIYSETSFINSVDIGYQAGTSDPVTNNYPFELFQAWGQVSSSFQIPEGSSDMLRVYIKINYKEGSAGTEYGFLVNGITIGQHSEQHNVVSLGVQSEEISSSIFLPENVVDGIETSSYGLPGNFGYYIVNKNIIKAKNFGVPMVFGSLNTTTLFPNGGSPSLILPALGFLNSLGQYQDLALEFWLRINSGGTVPKKVVGPIASDDGLYVDGDFLTLKIDNNIGSYFVGEWGRPMLITINVINNNANLLINGERVISMDYQSSELSFPAQKNENSKSQDWIGFYSDEEIGPIQIDCVGIYSYQISETLAKRRFVYGQAVKFPDNINSSYSSTSLSIDYAFANYANNYNYPDIGRWQNGIVDNLNLENETLTPPLYELPGFTFSNKTNSEWNNALKEANDIVSLDPVENFISLRPNEDWSETEGYLLFPQIDILKQSTKAFYGYFERSESQAQEQVLFKIVNQLNKNYLEIVLKDDDLICRLSYNNSLSEVFKKPNAVSGYKFTAGLYLEKLGQAFGSSVASFLGARSQLRLYVGGEKELSRTFSGKIYRVGFLNEKLLTASLDKFGADGNILSANDYQYFATLVASYTLFAKSDLVRGFYLDIYTSSSWSDYIPLTYFSKYVKNASNENYYGLDFIQFNIDYPEPAKTVQDEYYTQDSILKTYITFQSLKYRAKELDQKFKTTIPAKSNNVVAPGSYTIGDGMDNWKTTKYEVVNGSIIYPPSGVDLSTMAIAIHVELLVDGIKAKPIKIKKLQLASKALNDTTPTLIGSKFGVPFHPYSKLGIYFDYKQRNPFEIYKGSSPYLYLTKKSGIRLRGNQRLSLSRGLSSPVNQGLASSYNVGAVQLYGRFDGSEFPADPVEAFEIEGRLANSYIKFYLEALDSTKKRGKIFAVNTATGKIEEGLAYFVNGILAKEPIIDLSEWFVLGVQFSNKLDFAGVEGAIRITGPILINNLSHYQYTAYQEQESVRTRPWLNVLNLEEGTAEWSYWASLDEFNNPEFLWKDVLFVSTSSRSNVNPEEIYKIYTGTNKSITESDKALVVNRYAYKFYKDIAWQSYTIKPV
jgi:hypothetical protein